MLCLEKAPENCFLETPFVRKLTTGCSNIAYSNYISLVAAFWQVKWQVNLSMMKFSFSYAYRGSNMLVDVLAKDGASYTTLLLDVKAFWFFLNKVLTIFKKRKRQSTFDMLCMLMTYQIWHEWLFYYQCRIMRLFVKPWVRFSTPTILMFHLPCAIAKYAIFELDLATISCFLLFHECNSQ